MAPAPQKLPLAGRALLVLTRPGGLPSRQRRLWARRRMTVTLRIGPPRLLGSGGGYDLVAVDLSADAARALAWSVDLLGRDPAVALVLFCEDPLSAELAAVQALGVAPVIIGPGARAWLHRAAPGLMRIARTRRALLRLEAKLPPSPKPALRPAGHNPPVPLPVAEAKFREVYVRGLLATTPNRAQAAARAGITYRTLCRICQDVEAALARSAARRHRRKKQHSRSASREKRR